MKEKITGFFAGISYGIATAVPGLSGGTMLVIFGVYDKVCEALALDFKSIKKNFLFLLIFVVGAGAGLVGLAHAITFLIERIPLITYLLLSALILAGLPVVLKKANAEEKFSAKYLVPAVAGCAVVAALFIIEMMDVSGAAESTSPFRLVFSAALAGISSIIPGVSGAFVLVMLGVYEPVITAVKDFNFLILTYVGIGVLLGLIGGSRLITYLLKKAKMAVYYTIIGMIIGSVVMLVIDSIMKYA